MPILNMLLRIVLWMFIIRMGFSLMKSLMMYRRMRQGAMQGRQGSADIHPDTDNKPEPPEMVEDSCCGNLVAKSRAYSTYVQDKLHYFCSWECRQRYLSEH